VEFDAVSDTGGGEVADGLGKFEGGGVRGGGAGASGEAKYRVES
jgi:hypothetical protein